MATTKHTRRKREYVDLTGRRFGKLFVVRRVGRDGKYQWWECRCNCGRIRTIYTARLTCGAMTSCGCSHKPVRIGRENLTGQQFGRWTVIGTAAEKGPGWKWLCRCECGTTALRSAYSLIRGHSRSCGCYRNEVTGNRTRTHGMTETAEYAIWQGIKRRCLNPNEEAYPNYGGRGIIICDRWRDSFGAFLEDMGPRPGPEYSVDRFPDNDGNYEPGNCRWATGSQQMRNTRLTRWVEAFGVRLPLQTWAEWADVPAGTIASRLDHLNWSPEWAVWLPSADGLGKGSLPERIASIESLRAIAATA